MPVLWGKNYTRRELLRRVGDIRQLARVEPFEYVDGAQRGVRAVRMHNAAGVDLVVVPDRGMSIMEVFYNGVPLAFLSGVGVAHPAYSEHAGLGWLRTWPGGFLTPCGLNQVGSPAEEDGETLGLHGRAASIPAGEVRWGGDWREDDYFLYVDGVVRQVSVFGEDLSLRRRVGMWMTGSRFWVEDTVENHSFSPAPHMFLQHFNLGFPLVDEGTRLELPPHTTQPRDAIAQAGVARYNVSDAPQTNYQEQVFYHHLRADDEGQVQIRLVNPNFDHGAGLGVYWRYALADYPRFVQWKMMGEGLYVVGVEPSNCLVSGRAQERQNGTLQVLAPGEVRQYRMEIGFFR